MFEHISKHHEVRQKDQILRYASYVQLSSWVLGNVVNTVFCIGYIKSINFSIVTFSSYCFIDGAVCDRVEETKIHLYLLPIQSGKQALLLANL